jgi:hypothetical protein
MPTVSASHPKVMEAVAWAFALHDNDDLIDDLTEEMEHERELYGGRCWSGPRSA